MFPPCNHSVRSSKLDDAVNSVESDIDEMIGCISDWAENGFIGFENYTDQELKEAFEAAGLELDEPAHSEVNG
jgi:hypothetical protein